MVTNICSQFSLNSEAPEFSSLWSLDHITCSRAPTLESSEFSTIWLRLQCHSLTKFICAAYLSPNSSDYVKFFDFQSGAHPNSLSICWNLHFRGFQCSPTTLAFIFFHWPTWWTNLQLCYPSRPRAASAVPYPYLWPPWSRAQHSWSFPNFQPLSLLC